MQRQRKPGRGRSIPASVIAEWAKNNPLDAAAMATAPIPVVGDVVGGAADVKGLLDDPSWMNAGLLAAGLLPFVPAGTVKRVGEGLLSKIDNDGRSIGHASVASGGPFLSSIEINPEFRKKGIGKELYEAAEKEIGRSLYPSPLGLSERALEIWKKRLSNMKPSDAKKLLKESYQRGIDYGISENHMTERLSPLFDSVDLPTDEASRMARAREMGFDVDNPVYHGTRSEGIDAFRDDKIGSANDAGHYGRGHYFASTPGEAGFYGPNVGEYVTRGKFLSLDNDTGDYSYRGHFKSFAPKLDAIGALDDAQKQALNAIHDAERYVAENVEYLRYQDGEFEGWLARVPNPVEGYNDKISARPSRYNRAETKEQALEALKNEFIDEMERFHPEQFPGLGTETASLSDYVRVDSTLGADGLTRKAQEAGYDGITYGDETVVFDPRNIRSTKAEFDPSKADSADLLAGVAGLGLTGLLGSRLMGDEEEQY